MKFLEFNFVKNQLKDNHPRKSTTYTINNVHNKYGSLERISGRFNDSFLQTPVLFMNLLCLMLKGISFSITVPIQLNSPPPLGVSGVAWSGEVLYHWFLNNFSKIQYNRGGEVGGDWQLTVCHRDCFTKIRFFSKKNGKKKSTDCVSSPFCPV